MSCAGVVVVAAVVAVVEVDIEWNYALQPFSANHEKSTHGQAYKRRGKHIRGSKWEPRYYLY
jgi:hypothetical protein